MPPEIETNETDYHTDIGSPVNIEIPISQADQAYIEGTWIGLNFFYNREKQVLTICGMIPKIGEYIFNIVAIKSLLRLERKIKIIATKASP